MPCRTVLRGGRGFGVRRLGRCLQGAVCTATESSDPEGVQSLTTVQKNAQVGACKPGEQRLKRLRDGIYEVVPVRVCASYIEDFGRFSRCLASGMHSGLLRLVTVGAATEARWVAFAVVGSLPSRSGVPVVDTEGERFPGVRTLRLALR